MENCIESLCIDLINDQAKINEIDHWIKVFNWTNGWHYDLDIIWMLKKLELLQLPSTATILDAGAGLGMAQFILASHGYNVISLDFSERKIPKNATGIFMINSVENNLNDYHHPYQDFMTYGQRANNNNILKYLSKIKAFLLNRNAIIWYSKHKISYINSLLYSFKERKREHNNYGEITFLKGTFNNIPLDNSSIDAIVSISAFEHNTYNDMPDSVREFNRVLKDGSFMLITTSAAEEKDWFHKPSLGWCLTSRTLATWFNIDNINFDYATCYHELVNSENLKKRIGDYYKYNSDNGLPFADLSNAQYAPLGIVKQKT